MENENRTKYSLLLVAIFVVALIGGSYAWLRITLSGQKVNVIKAAALSLSLSEKNEIGINDEKALPVSDEVGLATEGYSFTLENTGRIANDYTIYLDDADLADGEERIPDNALKYVLIKNGESSKPALLNTTGRNPNRKLDLGKLEPGEKNTYTLKVWIDYDADNSIVGKVFSTKLRVEAEQEYDGEKPSEKYDELIDLNNSSELKIDIGENKPSDYTFESSDPDIAEVDEEGNVIAKGTGKVTITIKNKETGETEEKIIQLEKEITANYDMQEAEPSSCKLTEKGQTECTITLPEIDLGNKYLLKGWKREGSEKMVAVGTRVTISENTKFLSVIEKLVVVSDVTYVKNGIGIESIGEESAKCSIENNNCYVTLPEIVAKDGYEVIGWSTNKDITDKTEEEINNIYKPGEKLAIEEDTTLYTIIKSKEKTYTAKFYKNGSVSQDGSTDEYIERSCTIDSAYNNDQPKTSCLITSPSIIGSSNTPNVIGYSDEANKTETIVGQNVEFELNSNKSYYAITTNSVVTRNARFIKNGEGVSSIGDTDIITKSCDISATYNGVKQKESCPIMPPSITVKKGYTQRGWSQNKDAKVVATDIIGIDGYLPANKEIQIYSDTVVDYYSISSKDKITYEVNFHLNGATSQDGSTEDILKKTCEISEVYNNETQGTTCTITLPNIVASSNTPIVIGYAEEANATVGIEGTEIIVSNTSVKDYYAITKKDAVTLTADWNANNATLSSTTQKTCALVATYNGEAQATSCTVDAPTITAPTNTPTIVGYNTEANANKNNASYNTSTKKLTLTSSNTGNTWYAQTKKDAVTYTVSAYEKGSNVSSVGTKTDGNSKCTIAETYNGTSQATSCNVTAPSITAKTGYTSVGWSLTSGSSTGSSVIILTSSNTGKTWYANATANSYTIKYYDGTTLKGTSSAEVDTYPTLTKASNLSLSKTGYTFKGWSTTNGGEVAYTDGQTLTTNLATTAGAEVNLYAVWKDETKPKCTWSAIGATTTQNTTTGTLTCTDTGSGVVQKTLATSNFTTTSNGSVTEVSEPTAVTNGYKYTVTIKGLSVGSYTVSLNSGVISDNAGNTNEVATSGDATVNGRTYTATFTKNGKSVEEIGATSKSCTTTGSSLTCDIETPSITVLESYKVVGWNTDSNAEEGIIPGDPITLSENATYYTIYKQEKKEYTATFNLNGAIALDDESEDVTRKCIIEEVYNDRKEQETSCTVKTPVITASTNTPTILGLALTNDETDTKKMINTTNEVSNISINSNVTYYAITKKGAVKYRVTYTKNGIGVTAIEKESDSCIINETYNGEAQASSCAVETPSITVATGYESMGWAVSADEENESNIIKEKINIDLNKNVNYYSISRKTPVTYTATFNLNGAGTQTKADGSAVADNVTRTCKTNVTWNNNEPDTDCVIKTPKLTGSENTPDVIGYNTDSTSIISTINQNQDIIINSDITYYAITKKEAVSLTANWDANNATLSTTEEATCNLKAVYNGEAQATSCTVDAPTITAPTNTPTIVGYNTEASANKNNASYNTSTKKLTLTSSNTGNTWYAQTKKDAVTYTVGSFEKGLNVDSISSTSSKSCKIEAVYNGTKQETSCIVTPPSVNANAGYTVLGWNTSASNAEDTVSVISLSSNVDKYYAHATAKAYTIKYFDGETEKGSQTALIDIYPTLTKASELSLSKTGYTFKGWSTTNGGEVAYTDGNKLTSDLTTTVGDIINLYAVWKDETKPKCTWSAIGATTTQNTTTGTLTCTDTGSGVVQKTLATSNFTTTANGSVTAVSSPTAVTNGYKYTVTIKGLSVGSYTVSLNSGVISDNAGNTNEVATSGDATVNGHTFTTTFIKNGTGVSAIGTTTGSCTTTGSNMSCSVKTPTITTASGYQAVGWNTDSNAKTGTAAGSNITLSNNTTKYYSISYKKSVNYTVTFDLNGAKTQTKEDGSAVAANVTRSCSTGVTWNNEVADNDCIINTPIIEASTNTPIVIGYNSSSTGTVSEIAPNTEMTVTADKTYYAITKKDAVTLTANWNANNATLSSTTQKTCALVATYNGEAQATSCTVDAPTITAPTNTPTIVGYNTEASANKNNASYNTSTKKLTLTSSNTGNTWYAQTKKDAVTYTVSAYEKGSNVSSVGAKTDGNSKCTIAETYNGTSQATSCNVTAPSITAKTGFTSVGWSLTSGDNSGSSVLTLTSSNTGKTWYANATANSYTIKYYDGTTLKGTSSAKVDTYPTLTKASNLSLSKTGYTFKGWSTTNGGEVAYTDGQTLTTNLATTAGAEVNLYAVWKDETKPKCTWSAIGATTTQNTTTGTLTCTDTGSGVVQKTLATSNFTTTANGSVTEVSEPTAVTNGYKYTVTIKGLSVGTYTVSLNAGVISDNAGNTNEVATSSSSTVNGRTYTVTFTKNGSGVSAIGSTTGSCTTTGSSTSCDVKTPTITTASGYEAVGWNTSKTATTGTTPGSNITVSSNATYYSIAKLPKKSLSATFYKNGASKLDTATTDVTRTCTIPEAFNDNTQSTTCKITTPTIVASTNTPNVCGYATSATAKTCSVSSNTEISISGGEKYYAITYSGNAVTLTANWNANNATLSSTTQKTCVLEKTYNGTAQATSCMVDAPTITAPTNTPTIVGYNTTANANKNNASYNTSTKKLTLTSSNTGNTWYAQTKKDAVTYTVSAYEKGSNVSSVGTKTDGNSKCTIAETYNGTSQATSCNVTAPSITAKTGYTSVGWSTTSGSSTGSSVITLTSSNTGKTWYANATANSYTIKYYDGTTLKGTSSAKVDTYPTLTKASSLSLSKAGYTFKGWSTTSGGEVAYTDGQTLTTNLATTAGAEVNLYAVWKDETKPKCTWSAIGATTTQNTTTGTLTCTDTGSGVVQKTLATSNFTTTANGSVTAVSSPTAVTNGYKYTVTIKGLSVGTYTVSLNAGVIRDNAGNTNEVATSSSSTVNGRKYTATFTKNGGVSTLSKTTDSCTTTGSNLTCDITVPTVTLESNYNLIGWNTSSSATTSIASNNKVTLSSNATYYTISKKNSVTLTASWNSNGANLSSSTQSTCTIAEVYNTTVQKDSCSITAPTITRSGFTITGFNLSKDATTANFNSGATVYLSRSGGTNSDGITTYASGKTWYAITSKTITIKWNSNGETIGSTQTSCVIKNSATSCNITTPTIAERDGRVILGWYTTGGTKFADPGVSKSVNADATYVATSRALTASEVEYNNSSSGLKCTNAQCAVDEINTILSQ